MYVRRKTIIHIDIGAPTLELSVQETPNNVVGLSLL